MSLATRAATAAIVLAAASATVASADGGNRSSQAEDPPGVSAHEVSHQASTSSPATLQPKTTRIHTGSLAEASSAPATTSTTTPSCFEDAVQWEPLDMPGLAATLQAGERECQRQCLQTEGCSHFSFWKADGLCHLQDAFAVKRKERPGFVSGPFRCWGSITPGTFTQIEDNTFVPEKFRCMQVGITWQPALDSPFYIAGDNDEVVLKCQQRCRDTWGCEHFTAMFPSMCSLASEGAVPLPAVAATMSGPAVARCREEGYVGHTFMKKVSIFPDTPSLTLGDDAASGGTNRMVAGLALVACAMVAASIRLLQQHNQGSGYLAYQDLELCPEFSPSGASGGSPTERRQE